MEGSCCLNHLSKSIVLTIDLNDDVNTVGVTGFVDSLIIHHKLSQVTED